jgi:outer membrane protein assembly factor BamE (lipoprotein component of BamABCDE complex)
MDGMAEFRLWSRRGLAIAALVVLTGCVATFVDHGYAPTEAELENIIVGVDTRDSVEESIGRPSSTGMLRESAWYYVSSRVRTLGLREPKTIDRQLVAISYNKRGTVTNIERFTLEDGNVIALNRRVTATGIKGISFIRQALGNLGRVNLEDQLN